MMELTRRSFLKSLVALAAGLSVPIEVHKTIDFLIDQPEILVNPNQPVGSILINDKLMGIVSMNASKPLGTFEPIYMRQGHDYVIVGKSMFNPPHEYWSLDIKYYYQRYSEQFIRDLVGHTVKFSIIPFESSLVVVGIGVIENSYYEGGLVLDKNYISGFTLLSNDISFKGGL